jgi:hypothetical protein
LSTVYDGDFTLISQPDTVPASNIVRGGFPFYCGPIDVEFTYNYTPGSPTHLCLDGRFATAEITVNSNPAGEMLFTRTVDLAPHLKEGSNVIGVRLCNSMRNLMGPHHRPDPEPYIVYPNLLSYENEWHGRECAGYVPTYAFVKYGLKKA